MNPKAKVTNVAYRVAAVGVVFAAITFAGGFRLGRRIDEHLVVPTPPSPRHIETHISRFVDEGRLGYPLGTIIEITGRVYIDGAGFPLDGDRMAVESVNGKPHYCDIRISGGTLNGTTCFRGYEAVEKQKNFKTIDGKSVADPERPWFFERRFIVLENLADSQTNSQPSP